MSLSSDDMKWFGEKFEEVNKSVVSAVAAHEDRFHPPGRALSTVGALLGIAAAGVAVLGAMLAGLMWLIKHSP